jgi:hypothetical protein
MRSRTDSPFYNNVYNNSFKAKRRRAKSDKSMRQIKNSLLPEKILELVLFRNLLPPAKKALTIKAKKRPALHLTLIKQTKIDFNGFFIMLFCSLTARVSSSQGRRKKIKLKIFFNDLIAISISQFLLLQRGKSKEE